MHKLAGLALVVGCASHTPAPVTPTEPSPPVTTVAPAGATGGQGYGGQTYGGQTYGGQTYGGPIYGGQTYGGQTYGGKGVGVTSVTGVTGVSGEAPPPEPASIGIARYGTIGHGSGTGSGGGMSRRPASVPRVAIGMPIVTGDLDKNIVRRYIKRSLNKIMYCYEKQLLVRSTLAGTVTANFIVSSIGVVKSATASGMHADVASCIAKVIEAIEFPKPKGGGEVQISYPFNFRPSGG